MIPVPVSVAVPASFARPKSTTLTTSPAVTMTLAGLMSRWTIPCSCALARPLQICSAHSTAVASGSTPPCIRRFSVTPSQYAMQMKLAPSGLSPMS